MTRLEYLDILEQTLKKSMSQKEVNDIIRDYAEYFEDGKSQGKSDDEVAAKLGEPEAVAKQILEENGIDENNMANKFKVSMDRTKENLKNTGHKFSEKAKNFKISDFFGTVFGCIAGIIAIPILLCVFAAFVCLIAGILIALVAFQMGLILAAAGLFMGAVAVLIFAGISLSFVGYMPTILMIIMAVGATALALCLIGFTMITVKGAWNFSKRQAGRLFKSKEEKNNDEA